MFAKTGPKKNPWQLRQPDHGSGLQTQNGSSWWQKQVDLSRQREVTWLD